MQRFWATDGHRKWTFRTLGQWSLSDFQTDRICSENRLNNINVVVWREVKYENSALPVAVRGSKTLHAKLPTQIMTRAHGLWPGHE